MTLRELMELVESDSQGPRDVAKREAKAISVIGNALANGLQSAPDHLRTSDRNRLEQHLDEIDMATKRIRDSLKKWKV